MNLTEDLKRILNIGISLTGEKNYNRLLEKILAESMEITNSDAGTLYVVAPLEQTNKEDCTCSESAAAYGLKFMIMRNQTLNTYQGGMGEQIDLPDVPFAEENVCSYSAIHHKIVNIPDVYHSDEFNFTGPKRYDKMTGYRTKSMLVIPLENHDNKTLGVIQLINAKDKDGNVISYEPKFEFIVFSIASQAAITLDNMNHVKEMKGLLNSMVAAFTTAIDERTPYNANHTKNVAKYTEQLIDYINNQYESGNTLLHYSENEKEQLVMAAMLHDIGKIVTPLEVMNKSTRLGGNADIIINRLEQIASYIKIDFLEGRLLEEEHQEKQKYLEEMKSFVKMADTIPFLEDEMIEKIQQLSKCQYQKEDGTIIPYITEQEKINLMIVKGTLNEEERKIMEEHVAITSRLLEQIRFGRDYKDVPKLAGSHHEYLNGTGYPKHLTEETMPKNAEVLPILDIYDSLISTDRPYKKQIPKEKAIHILEEMVEEGKLDKNLVFIFRDMILNEYEITND